MSQSIEIEFKNLLTEDEFFKLLSYFRLNENDFFIQDNHYFDTPDFLLKENKMALRVRQKGEYLEMTLKQPHTTGLLETNEQITLTSFNLLKAGHFPEGQIAQILSKWVPNLNKIEFFGTLRTSRYELGYKNGLLVFDKSTYLDTQDYELEYEVENETEGYQNFHKLLNTLNIVPKQTKNKVMRFYLRKKELMKGEFE